MDSLEAWRTAAEVPGSLNPSPFFFQALSKAANLIDIGCGAGRLTSRLARRPGLIVSVDRSLPALMGGNFIDVGTARIVGDARQLPFRDEVASAVSMQAVLTVIPNVKDQLSVASEVARIIAPGVSCMSQISCGMTMILTMQPGIDQGLVGEFFR